MGSPVPADATWALLGKANDEDDRTAIAPDGNLAAIPVQASGFQLGAELAVEDLETEHRTPGILFSNPQSRGANEGSLATYATPRMIGTLLKSVLERRTSGLTPYRNVKRFFRENIAGVGVNQLVGQHLIGVLFNQLSFNVDKDSGASVVFTLNGWVNDDRLILLDDLAGDATPVPAYPDKRIFRASAFFVDLQFTDENGDFPATWGGRNPDLRGLQFQFSRGQSVEGFEPDLFQPSRNYSWAAALPGTPSGQLQVRLRFSNDEYLKWNRGGELTLARARLMAVSGAPTSAASTTGNIAAGSAVNCTINAASNFADGSYVILDDGTNQAVAQISSGGGTTTLVLDELDVDIASGAAIRDTAFEVQIPRMRVGGFPQPQRNGNILEVNTSLAIQVAPEAFASDPDNADAIIVKAYDEFVAA